MFARRFLRRFGKVRVGLWSCSTSLAESSGCRVSLIGRTRLALLSGLLVRRRPALATSKRRGVVVCSRTKNLGLCLKFAPMFSTWAPRLFEPLARPLTQWGRASAYTPRSCMHLETDGMCSDPQTDGIVTWACRHCDECISTRRADWEYRAAAERAMHRHGLVVTLTYNDETQESRDAASMFNYGHVSAWLKRLRSAVRHAIRRKLVAGRPGVRFIVAGEQGSRHGRCHFHIVLFSDVDLFQIGDFSRFGRILTKPADLLTVGKREIRLDWSLWPWGFVTLQEANQAGMAYALKYCLKDQFTVQKSKGTMREAKAENFATGLFRPSKKPPIGCPWVEAKLARLLDAGSVLPHLQIKIPGIGGFWYPRGLMRQRLLAGLRQVNDLVRERTGRDAPQWSSLVASVTESDNDTEALIGTETHDDDDEDEFARELALKGAERSREGRIAATVRNCGRKYPCSRCLRGLDPGTLERLGVQESFREKLDGQEYADFFETASGRWLTDPGVNPSGGRLNPHCGLADSERSREAFPASSGSGRA